MATFNFTVPIYGFDQWTGASTNNTVGYPVGTTFSLNAGAALTVINVEDDDGTASQLFSDGYIDTPGDGLSPSTANNDQVLSQAVTINGQTFQPGDQVELEFGFTTTSGDTFWVIRIDGVNVGISGPVLPTPGTTYEVAGSSDGQASPISNVPCFTAGTLITTKNGTKKIEDLSVGDLVLTYAGSYEPIRWIGRRELDSVDFSANPKLVPIRISAGALGAGLPTQDLTVSPQHRILVRSKIAQRMFNTNEVLVSAKSLLPLDGIDRVCATESVCYFHLLFDTHQVIFANDTPSESLFAGPQALKSIPEAARAEILALFPELGDPGFEPRPAALIPKGHKQRGLISRHLKNGQALLA
ncbi:Hint domain-containing protein [Ruegeria arenilitoris]|uniref:Hint domain-containing protein n=1 Tax=Ruegeria arenilitoris TaxID=1173585 RepID=UPI0020C23BEA|nr:Hint domain-containing protein [Ruegeria arenilitoris]